MVHPPFQLPLVAVTSQSSRPCGLLLVCVVVRCLYLLLDWFFVASKADNYSVEPHCLVRVSKFHIEAPQFVLRAVRPQDWMVSVDLQDAYLQVPVHPESRRYLRFSSSAGAFQFRVLCFGLSLAPQVFSRVMAPVSAFLHRRDFHLMSYLDDWLLLDHSLPEILRVKAFFLSLCLSLGIVINEKKSSLTPTQVKDYLGIRIRSDPLWVFPPPGRIHRLSCLLEGFLSSSEQPIPSW